MANDITTKHGTHTVTNGNVILVEPNDFNTNQEIINGVPFVNGIPQYQDMFVFAELIATSKGRTVVINNGGSNSASSTNTTKVNMMGNADQDNPQSPNYLKFTTNYYDGSTGSNTQYEGFGISSIKVTVNASYVPQVSIQFVDVRGLTFFNQQNSPYRILFDFPPPIFTLSIKGYYGKSLTYQLHLVKYTTEFQAENGNFIINCDFVAMTFAPLSDVLLRYIINTPLIDDTSSMSPDSTEPPTTTYSLILKLRNLYSTIADKLKSQPETQNYDKSLKQLEGINNFITTLNQYADNENLKKGGKPYMLIKTVTPPEFHVIDVPAPQANQTSNYQWIKTVNDYDATIKDGTTGIKSNINTRLYIAYIAGTNNPPVDETDKNPLFPDFGTYTGDEGRITGLKIALDAYGATLTAAIPSSVDKKPIPRAKDDYAKYCIDPPQNTSTRYVLLDITDCYISLYKEYVQIEKQKNDLSAQINNKINSMVIQTLGMLPTVYNIFEIICNDVDKFFQKLRDTSNEAEKDHNQSPDKGIIAGNQNSDVTGTQIYAFPLVINSEAFVSGGNREERVAPIQLKKVGARFPELDLVQNFIDTFQRQGVMASQYNMRSEQNDDGTYKWIPVSPFDSTLGDASPSSPYLGALGTNASNLPKVYQTLLRRYYILTQGTIPDEYYIKNDAGTDAYFQLYARSEAANLAASLATLLNPEYTGLVKTSASDYLANIPKFYQDMGNITDENGLNLFRFPTGTVDDFQINPTDATKGLVYVDKTKPEYEGVNLYPENIVVRPNNSGQASSNPIDNFNNNAEGAWYVTLFKGSPSAYWNQFTMQNVVFLKDADDKDGKNTMDNVVLTTRYLTDDANSFNIINPENTYTYNYNNSLANGNTYLGGKTRTYASGNLNKDTVNITELWSQTLTQSDKILKHNVIDTHSNLSAMMLLSSFGYALGPFNSYPKGLNTLVFRNPAAIEVPAYLPLYVGALVDALESGWVSDITNFFTVGSGKTLSNAGLYIGADLHDIKNYMSAKDKEKFRQEYSTWYADDANGYGLLLKNVQKLYADANSGTYGDLGDSYKLLLNPLESTDNTAHGNSYPFVIQPLITRKNIIVYSQITFRVPDPDITYNSTYVSLATGNTVTKTKKINDTFFTTFFRELSSQILVKEKQVKEEKDKQDKIKGDTDVITQLYYSFKNINDKWLSGPTDTVIGYPFNRKGKRLIDSFTFVDRAMNPIGDTILNAELLPQMLENTDISVFTALSQLLSSNGFEFFPLQNFMSFDQKKSVNGDIKNGSNEAAWEDCFKITTNTSTTIDSAFVCMYIGGSSSYPSNIGSTNNGFTNDGIQDISNPGVKDFKTIPPKTDDDEKQVQQYPSFPWRAVRAFRVRFGEQNQSMFTDIKIDSKEYPETNESIQILARLAGDNKAQAPTPKGQNLYNLYENRSYRATVTSMGNAMIQPTQYFQLENIPIFNGAYIILNVEHTITANKMMTTFSGTKMLKYPSPRVLSPVAFVGFDGDISEMSAGQIVQGALLVDYPQTKYNSMYTLKIT